jgi:hypothetical protein
MSLSAITAAGPVQSPIKTPDKTPGQPPAASSKSPSAPPARPASALQGAGAPPAEDEAFQVSTINQRLAWIAATRSAEQPGSLDIKA